MSRYYRVTVVAITEDGDEPYYQSLPGSKFVGADVEISCGRILTGPCEHVAWGNTISSAERHACSEHRRICVGECSGNNSKHRWDYSTVTGKERCRHCGMTKPDDDLHGKGVGR